MPVFNIIQQVLSPYHAMGCNPVSMVDPLGLRAGMFPETHGAGGPTQMDIALMTPPTILLDRMYGFGNDPWTMMNRGALNDYDAKMAGQQRLIEAVSGLLAVRRYNYHVRLESQRLELISRMITNYSAGVFNDQESTLYQGNTEERMMTILKYGVDYIPANSDRPALVQGHLLVTYNGEVPKGFASIEYMQNVYTNSPSPGSDPLFVDGHPSNTDIFYHEEGIDRLVVGDDVFKREGLSGKYKYFDFPTRPVTNGRGTLYWKAELSLVGIRSDGSASILETLTWGFTYKSVNSIASYFKPVYTKSSFFNQFVINNRWMFQKNK